jgi:plasmid stabilization system protein ParE
MNYVPVFRPIVQQEMDEAYDWYEIQRPELGDEFLECVSQQVHLICQAPEAYRIIYRDVRRALVKRFPYAIYYRIISSRIIIIAVIHTRRNPKKIKSRT